MIDPNEAETMSRLKVTYEMSQRAQIVTKTTLSYTRATPDTVDLLEATINANEALAEFCLKAEATLAAYDRLVQERHKLVHAIVARQLPGGVA